MSLFENRYYYLGTFLLTCIGQWPYQKTMEKFFFRVLGLTTLMGTLLPMLAYIYEISDDLDGLLDCFSNFFVVITAIGKSIVCICKEKELLKLFECIENDWKIWSSGPELEILKNYAEKGRFFCLLFSGNSYFVVATLITVPLTSVILDTIIPLNETHPKLLVYQAEFFVDQDKYYKWLFLYSVVTAVYYVTVIAAWQCIYAIGTQHACGLFAIISYRLKNAIEEKDCFEADKKQYKEEKIYEYMSFAIQRHNYAIRYTEILESCFTLPLFFEMGFNMLEISVLGFQMVQSLGDISRTIQLGGCAVGVIVYLFFFSLPSQKMTDHSIAVAHDVYDGCWYQMPIKSRKLLRMIMMQGSIPRTITAIKFFPVNMVTFSTILKMSFSYFTVLSSSRS